MADESEKSGFGEGSSSGSVPAAPQAPRQSRSARKAMSDLRADLLMHRRECCRRCGRWFEGEDTDWLTLVRTEYTFPNGIQLAEETLLCEDCRQLKLFR